MNEAAQKPAVNPWFVAFIVSTAAFLEVLDSSVGNVAVPHIAGNLSSTMSQATWVLTSYIVANSVVLPLSGWLSSVLGRKKYFLLSIILFTVTSGLCGLAPNLPLLVLFRVLQGLSGGGLLTVSQAILADTFPAKELGKGMAAYAVAIIVAPIVGPVVGGWITDNFNWRWIFLINLPIGAVSAALVVKYIQDPPGFKRLKTADGIKLDYIGITLLSVGIAAIQCVLDRGQEVDWFASKLITTATITGVGCMIAAIIWELRVKNPVVDIRLLKNANVSIASVVIFVSGFVIYGSSALWPMLMQSLMGYNAYLAGLALAPGGIAAMVVMPIMGLVVAKGRLRWYVTAGLVISAFSMYMMQQGSLAADFKYMVVSRVISAVGVSMIMLPSMTAAFAFVPASKNDAVSGITNLARNIGGSVGIAILTVILDRRSQYHQNILISHMTPYDPHYTSVLAGTAHALGPSVGAANAPHAAQGILYMQMRQQSAMLSFLDGFYFMAVISLAVIPLALLLKSPKHASAGPIGMH